MGQSASQAAVFYREVARSGRLWTIRDSGGYPAPLNSEGRRSQPFWSSLTRTQKVIATVPAYSAFEPVELPWAEFRARWVPGLSRDGILVGVNWSGLRATGFDVPAEEVARNVEAETQAPIG